MSSEELNNEVWARLLGGRRLDDLPLATRKGRIDLRGLQLPHTAAASPQTAVAASPIRAWPVESVKWESLDFTGSILPSLRFFGADIRNCSFERCHLEDWKLWSTSIVDSTFTGADLWKAALGGVKDGIHNRFCGVDFSGADLRQTSYDATTFSGCQFRHAKLDGVDFQGSVFTDCVFEGELHDVTFHRGGRGQSLPPNEMLNVDFSDARLRFVEFQGLSLDRVRFPANAEHLVIRNFGMFLNSLLETLHRQEGEAAIRLDAYLRIIRKGSPAPQAVGMLNMLDLIEIAGDEGAELVQRALRVPSR